MSAGPQIVPDDDLGFQPLGKKQAVPGDDLGFQSIPAGAPKPQPQLDGLAGPATGISAQPKQTFLERIQNVFRQGVPRYSTRTVEDPKFGAEQLVTPEAALSPAEQTRHPIATGAAEFTGGLTTPESLGFIAATGGLGELGGVAGQTARRLASAGFSAQMLHSAYQQAPALAKAINEGNYAEAERLATILGLTAGTAGLAGGHAIGGEPAAAAKVVPEAKPAPAEAAGGRPTEPRMVAPQSGGPRVVSESEQTALGFKPIEPERPPSPGPEAPAENITVPPKEVMPAAVTEPVTAAAEHVLPTRSTPTLRHPPDVLEDAARELEATSRLWQALPEVARFERAAGEPGAPQVKGARSYPVPSSRTMVQAQHPWVAGAGDVSPAKLRDALAERTGSEYDRLLGRAASWVQAQRDEGAPVIREFAPRLRELADQVRDREPGLAEDLERIASGRVHDVFKLREYIGTRIADAQEAAGLQAALRQLDAAASEHIPTRAEEFSGPAGAAPPEQGPTRVASPSRLGPGLPEQAQPAGRERISRLAERFARPAESTEERAGEMERAARVFPGTPASPQAGMFEPRATREVIRPVGPGSPAVGQTDVTEIPLRQLTESIGRIARLDEAPATRVSRAAELADRLTRGRDAVEQAATRMRTVGAAMVDALRRPPVVGDYESMKGGYTLAQQKSAVEVKRFAQALTKAIPERARREAMGVWVEANGDERTLRDWAERSRPRERVKYQMALKLTDAERTIATNIRNFQDQRADDAIAAGILEHTVANYLMHVWERQPNELAQATINMVRTDLLQTVPSFALRRAIPTLFEAERLGYTARTADIGALAAAHEHALNEALAARGFVKALLDATARDGRPAASVSGSGVQIREEDAPAAYLIRPRALPSRGGGPAPFEHELDIRDFRPIDHPALREWKWVAADAQGRPIFVQGDIVINPEFFRDLKNVLTKSALREWRIPGTEIRPGAAALRLSREFKETLLSLSAFHQAQVTLHSLEHRVNPANLVELDLEDPRQAGLVRGGLMVASYSGEEDFAEGLVGGGGLLQRVPGVGPKMALYRNWLFSSYVPRLKTSMALAALARNEARYGSELSEPQLYRLTANQANAAFGEMNYTMLGRNRTFQDVLRLALLAPDFLEARTRFVAQALKPYGREQLEALALGAAALYVGARIVNQILNGDAKWAPQDAFSVIYRGKAHVVRTVQGDLLHLLADPRSFVFTRLNPLYGRGAIEAITGRDVWGRQRTAAEQARDLAKGAVPVPLQGWLRSTPQTLFDSFLTAMGMSSFAYRSPAARIAHQAMLDRIPATEQSPEERQAARVRSRLVQEIRLGKATTGDLARALRAGQITRNQYRRALEDLRFDPLQSDVRGISLEQSLKVWDQATPEERREIAPLIVAKAQRAFPNRTADERARLIPKVHTILSYAQQEGR